VNRIVAGSGEGWSCGDGRFGALLGGVGRTASVSSSENVILNSPWLLYVACWREEVGFNKSTQ